MRLKLTRLVWITCIALLGIIALQVFWLLKTYDEQKKKVITIAETALQETMVFTGVNPMMKEAARSMVRGLLKDYADGKIKFSDSSKMSRNLKRVSAREIAMNITDTDTREEFLRLIDLDSSQHTYTVQQYKVEVQKQLKAKHIDFPFELAIVGLNGNNKKSTIDSNLFNKIYLKTTPNFSILVNLNPGLSGHAVLAFPHAPFYLAKAMWLILLLSLSFITICAFSFSYMVALFYKQKKLAEIRNDFMNNMTHELKTPISSVSVALELLRDNSVAVSEEKREEYFNIAGNELTRLTRLVDKVLNMAAFQKMQVKLSRSSFPVKEWVDATLLAMKPLIEASRANINLKLEPEDLAVYADKNQMSAVLQNLLENAIKYVDTNKLFLKIMIEITTDENTFYLKVKDNGIGIQGQHLGRIFDKFFRVPTGDEHETKGYGLGLSYIHEIIRLHGGKIEVESEWKKETTFLIAIPKSDN